MCSSILYYVCEIFSYVIQNFIILPLSGEVNEVSVLPWVEMCDTCDLDLSELC
jgi:hypothetical protein